MSTYRRRRVLVDPAVQGALARRIILHWACFVFVASVATFVLTALANPFRPLADHVADLWWTQGSFLLVAALLVPAFIVDTIKVSNRFAGPILNLRRAMREIASGKPATMLNFRDGDFWQELADDFNAAFVRTGNVQQERFASIRDPDEPVADEPLIGARHRGLEDLSALGSDPLLKVTVDDHSF